MAAWKGVWFSTHTKKWHAKTRFADYPMSLGRLDTQLEAMLAYDRACVAKGLRRECMYSSEIAGWKLLLAALE